jgi:hypothetical protein
LQLARWQNQNTQPRHIGFEQWKHDWVQIDGAVKHFRQAAPQKNSN